MRKYDAGGEIINYKRRIKRNRRRRRITLFLLFSAIIIGVVFRAPFFAISRIDLIGVNVTAGAVQDFANELVGKNINWYNLNKINETLMQLPYVRTARVTRHFPNILRINIEERVPFAQVQVDGLYYLIDKDGKVLECSPNEPREIELRGITEPPNEFLADTSLLIFKNYTALAAEITEHNITGVTWIDLSDPLNMKFQMGDILVQIGTTEKLAYKFDRLVDIRGELPNKVKGSLDITNGAKAYFKEEY